MLWIKQTKKPILPEYPKITEWNIGKPKKNLFFFVTIGPKNRLYKQDHSITSPESQNVIKMRTTKKTIKKGLHARESLFSMKPKILFFIFSKIPFFFPIN